MKKKIYHKIYDLQQIKNLFNNNVPILLSFIFYVFGLIFSAVPLLQYNKTTEGYAEQYFATAIASENEYIKLLIIVATVNFILLIFNFFLGFCAIAKPLILSTTLTNGFLTGLVLCGFVRSVPDAGIYFTFTVLVPSFVVFATSHLSACTQSIFLSSDLYVHLFKKDSIETEIRTYLKRYVLMLILVIIGCLYMTLSGLLFIRIVN